MSASIRTTHWSFAWSLLLTSTWMVSCGDEAPTVPLGEVVSTRAELTAFMKKEDAKWGAIVRDRKITAN
jgi:hypothetical protein